MSPLESGAPPHHPPVPASALTPTLRVSAKRSLFWVVAAVGALVVAVIATLLAGGAAEAGRPLAADNAAPAGAQALVQVLRDRGVTVTVTDSLRGATQAHAAATDATLFVTDPDGYLESAQFGQLGALAERTVLVDPNFAALQALAPGVGFGGVSDADTLEAGCDLSAARQAGTLTPGGRTLSIDPAGAGTDAVGCFPSGDDRFSLIELPAQGGTSNDDPSADKPGRISLIADPTLFSNDRIGSYGNAALALNLLGASTNVIWYLPTLADVPRTGPPSLGELTPGWVTPVLLLLVLTTITAALWRGRRFGALVPENLPVTVKGSETMEGRARLYSRGNARLRALDSLRIGAVQRLARQLGLGRSTHVDDVLVSVAAITERPLAAVRAVLLERDPASDRELMALSDAVRELESATVRASTPEAHAADAAGPAAAGPAAVDPTAASSVHRPTPDPTALPHRNQE
ncbi:MAG: DUF4350 domain-containing protein [Cryobacterium sp.]